MRPFHNIGHIIRHTDGHFYLIIPSSVHYRLDSPFAAWFTEWVLEPGTFRIELTRFNDDVTLETARYPAVTVIGTVVAGDNASRRGGVVVGEDTILQRLGNVEQVVIYIPKELLHEVAIE